MKSRMNYIGFTVAAVAIAACVTANAEVTKVVDPSGTWRWEHDRNGVTVKDVLKLNFDGKKLTGVYQGNGKPIKIGDGKVEADVVSFSLSMEYDGLALDLRMSGKVKGDELSGNTDVSGSGISEQFPWKAKRSLQPTDVVGTWNLEIDTPEGTNKSQVKIALSGDKKLTAKLTGTRGEFVDVSDIVVKDNRLSFVVTGEFDGTFLTANYVVRPLGDKLTGNMEYDYGGQEGELSVKGKREQS